jgi:branched-chain amino acid transport system substrate-binding protein
MKKIVIALLVLAVSVTTAFAAPKAEGSAGGEDTLKIAVILIMNHEAGDKGRFICDTMRDEVNKAGGVNGKMLELVYLESGQEQQSYITAVQKAVNTPGVDAIIGTFFSQYAIASSQFIQQAQIPNINICTNYQLAEMNDYFYITRPVDKGLIKSFAQIAIDGGARNPSLVFVNSSSGYQQAEFIKSYYQEKRLGVAAEIFYDPENTSDFTPFALQAMNSPGSDGIILYANASTDGQSLIRLFHDYNYTKPLAMCNNLFTSTITNVTGGQAVAGKFGYAEYAPDIRTPGNDTFKALMKEKGYKYDPDWIGASYYDAMLVFIEAAKLGGTDKAGVQNGLKQIKNVPGAMSIMNYHNDKSFAEFIYYCSYAQDGSGTIISGDPIPVVHE